MSRHWQHDAPPDCPHGHGMFWLGASYWICCTCHKVYVAQERPQWP